jgi:chorismate mutase
MVEVHPGPGNARSDADQQITPEQYGTFIESLIFRQAHPTPPLNDRLQELRDVIDQLDEEIAQKLGSRMDIAERIGDHKREHNVAILQPERWERILKRQMKLAQELGLSPEFIQEFMDAIHRESIRRQSMAPENITEENSSGSPLYPGNGKVSA